MSKRMHTTTVQVTKDQWDFMETWCFEHGISFAAWIRQHVAELRRREQERLKAFSGTRPPLQ